MVFGELVEPSTRSLWDDELAEVEDENHQRPPLKWTNDIEVPPKISNILVGETAYVLLFLQKCFLDGKKPLCQCASLISVYDIGNNSYIILFSKVEDIIVGELTELLNPWLTVAENIYTLTSAPLPLYQNRNKADDVPCTVRCLTSSKARDSEYLKLEVPNMVTGLGASILSFCAFQDLVCTLFVAYFDEVPLDSISAQPLLDLIKYLGFTPNKNFILENKLPSHNLYM